MAATPVRIFEQMMRAARLSHTRTGPCGRTAASLQHADSTRRPRRRCIASFASQEEAATAIKAQGTCTPLCYGPTLRAMKASSEVHSELERELFEGGGSSKVVPTPHDARMVRTVPEMQQLLVLATEADSFCPSFTTAVLTSLPKLRKLGPRDSTHRPSLQAIADSMVQKLLPEVQSLDAPDLVAVAVALAKLGHDEQHVYQELANCSVAHIESGAMSPQGLSNLVWALATAGVRPSGAWLSEFWQALEHQMDELSGQDVANIFWSICRLEIMPPWVSGSMPGMLSSALRRVGSASSGEDPATIMVCMAIWSRSYSYHPPDAQLAELLTAMQPHLQQYGSQDLVSVVHSLVVMNASPSRAWMTDFYIALRDRHPCPQDLSRLLWALSRIDYIPSQAWLRHFVEDSAVKLQQLRFRALAELAWALSCWGYNPSQEWWAEYFRCTYHKLQDYKPNHLANTLVALKKLGCQVPALWLDAALTSFCIHLSDAKAHDLVAFIDSIVDICDDHAWMSRPSTGKRLRSLADHAASKFHICDTIMNAKLLIALATAKCFPGVAWLNAQQDYLARSLVEEPGALDTVTAGNLLAAYTVFDVPLNPHLQHELDAQRKA